MSEKKLPRSISVDPYSAAVSPIDMFYGDTHLSRGTAFYWKQGDEIFLVTNWHNFSAKNPFTGAHISPTAAEPNRFSFDTFQSGNLNQRRTATIDLFDAETPKWYEHPALGQRVDVVCIKIDFPVESVFPINAFEEHPITTKVSNEVFVLGYPMGIDTLRLR